MRDIQRSYDNALGTYNMMAEVLGRTKKVRGDVIFANEMLELQNAFINKAFGCDEPFIPDPYGNLFGWCMPYEDPYPIMDGCGFKKRNTKEEEST